MFHLVFKLYYYFHNIIEEDKVWLAFYKLQFSKYLLLQCNNLELTIQTTLIRASLLLTHNKLLFAFYLALLQLL